MFFDQKSYTTILETLHPNKAAIALQFVKKWVSECSFRQNARIKGFYGDAFVIEVYPLHSEDRANTVRRTAQVAWDLCEGVDELNRQLVGAGLPVISFRFGAHFGLAANVDVDLIAAGTSTLIGDAVNLAQRIQSHAGPGTVYVSEQVAGPSRDQFAYEAVGNKYVKGRSGLVVLHRLVGEKSSGKRIA